jgi:hypothetical protein
MMLGLKPAATTDFKPAAAANRTTSFATETRLDAPFKENTHS